VSSRPVRHLHRSAGDRTDVDGGYAEYAYASESGVVRVPVEFAPTDASPLLCAGLTTYKAVLRADARPGTLLAVQGIGGLGHLGLQYADKLGYRVAAIARGTDKAELAKQLGVDHYIDSAATDPAVALKELGGAAGIVATASNGASMSGLVDGLAPGATRSSSARPLSDRGEHHLHRVRHDGDCGQPYR
jgi:alcohol dehydrogenase, propanol-preferring